jgi:peptidoglycan/xylan/chitin deacetylase (PgdA/CDA1 family)
MKTPLSQAEKLGFIFFVTAFLLLIFSPAFTAIPLILFLCCCSIAPFFPQWGFFLPIISKGQSNSKCTSLTFDDGPTPETTPKILELLARYNIKATFFVIGKKAEQYPDLILDILTAGHTIGNHSWKHDSLLMLRSQQTLYTDIHKSQQLFATFGVRPLLFRPPIGITNPLLKAVLQKEKLQTVTFSCRVFDGGNRKIVNLAERILKKLNGGDIILLHDLAPQKEIAVSVLLKELTILFSSLTESGPKVIPLEELIAIPVMSYLNGKEYENYTD